MAAREAVYLTATALESNLQTKLNALSVESGESVPTVAGYRDVFSDDDLEGADWPVVQTIWDASGGEFELESFSKFDVGVPLLIRYQTEEADTADARARLSYVFRAVVQVLNDISQDARNNVQLIQYLPRGAPRVGLDGNERLALELPLTARMRDNAP